MPERTCPNCKRQHTGDVWCPFCSAPVGAPVERVPVPDVAQLRQACLTAAEFTAAMRKATEAIESSASTATAAIRRLAILFAKHNRQHGQVVTMSDGVTRWVPWP